MVALFPSISLRDHAAQYAGCVRLGDKKRFRAQRQEDQCYDLV